MTTAYACEYYSPITLKPRICEKHQRSWNSAVFEYKKPSLIRLYCILCANMISQLSIKHQPNNDKKNTPRCIGLCLKKIPESDHIRGCFRAHHLNSHEST